jgi:ribose-phosphate pyrophosphokinase
MGHAKKVYCVAVHALFGDDSLEELEDCECIDHIVVTNTFPITSERMRESKKLIVIDLANLLAEAIRRNHHGGKPRKVVILGMLAHSMTRRGHVDHVSIE